MSLVECECGRLLRPAPTGAVLGLDDDSCQCLVPDFEIVRERGEGT